MTKKDDAQYFVAHACLNSRLPKDSPYYCNIGFIDKAPNKNTSSEQCWKYCPSCEAKGFPEIKKKPISKEMKRKLKLMRLGVKNKKLF